MPTGSRFIPITISLDGRQTQSDFNRIASGIVATAERTSQSIIRSNQKANDDFIATNRIALEQFTNTEQQFLQITQQTFGAIVETQTQAYARFETLKRSRVSLTEELAKTETETYKRMLENRIRDEEEAAKKSLA